MSVFRISSYILPLLFIPCVSWVQADSAEASSQTRASTSEPALRFWLENMFWHHRYSLSEMSVVSGLPEQELRKKLDEFQINDATRPPRGSDRLLVLPYPGGRHPRIGFLEGAIDPQRDTKMSVFCPWDDTSYVVMDIPEAIWSNLGLTYLAHTHIDTVWDKQGIRLPQREWEHEATDQHSRYVMSRKLPNGIEFGTIVNPEKDHVLMLMWLKNGSDQPLTDLRVQNCVMLRGAAGFEQQTKDNKLFIDGYAVAHSPNRTRWIISSWTPLHRAWGNPKCPCLHSDPKFSDCAPGETKWLHGWQSFYSGTDIESELRRIEASGWKTAMAEKQ